MTAKPKTIKNGEAGSLEWLEMLGKGIDALGHEDFPQFLVDALKKLTDFDNAVIFAYYKSERPLCLFHTFTSDDQIVFVDDYLKGPFLLDPFFKACGKQIDSGLYRLRDIAPDRFYQSEYYNSYYVQTGLSEELGYCIYLPQGVALIISIMRSGGSSRFSSRQFRLLQSVVPIINSLVQRHWHDVHDKFDPISPEDAVNQEHSMIENRVSDLFKNRITPRETQVVAQVLEGHSSDSIAKNLGITVGTVRIHRRNIYAKLQISSQQELFSIFFKTITKGQ